MCALRRAALVAFAVASSLASGPPCALAAITPATVVAGPSATILGVGNVAMSADGTGGVVWRQVSGGVPHIFASRFSGYSWSRPLQVDTGQPGPATFPAIAAGNDGELLVVWVQPFASISTGGGPPVTTYALMSSLLQPGSPSFGPVEQVDPNNVGDASGVFPSVAMAPDGNAFIAYRVVTNSLTPGQPQPPGTIQPMRPGDELVDVRVAKFNGLYWSPLGAVNAFPGQVTMRKPTSQNAPVIGIDPTGQAMVVWQEPTIDGVARIWARRIFGSGLGNVLKVSPQTINGMTVSADADAPALAFGQTADAEVVFRLQGGSGSPLSKPYVFLNAIQGQLGSGGDFSGAVPLAGGTSVGAPSVATDAFGQFQSAFTIDGQSQLVIGTSTSTTSQQTLGAADGDPALTALEPGGGGAAVWPGRSSAGLPVVQVREFFRNGGSQDAALSAPISGPISSLTIGQSQQGDALIAFGQGSGSTTQLAVAEVRAPIRPFAAFTPLGWVKPSKAVISWQGAETTIGQPRYTVAIDGRPWASGLTAHDFKPPASELGDGVYRVQVLASDDSGQETITGVALLKVDATPPEVSAVGLPGHRLRVRIRNRYSGARARGTSISFGDGSAAIRNKLKAVHRYRARGLYLLTVHCVSGAGVRGVDHIWVPVA